MAGNTGVKTIVNQAILALKQREPVCGHNQVQVSGFSANGTITTVYGDFAWYLYFKLHPSAMTTACTYIH